MNQKVSPSIAVRCENLCKSYRRRREHYVLHDVSFEVHTGALWAVVGPNGAGKTTLLHLILGLLRPLRGRLELFGSENIEAQRGRLGYLPEKEVYPMGLTGLEYLTRMSVLSGVRKESVRPEVEGALERFGLTDAAGLRLSEYSAGMLKRLGLAAAVVGDPSLIVMDEPADNLDPSGQSQMPGWFRQLRDEGRTLLLATHHLEALRAYGDDLLILCEGKVAYRGTLRDLQGPPLGYQVDFEEDCRLLLGRLQHGNLPFEAAGRRVLLRTADAVARRTLLEIAGQEGLTLSQCEPVYSDLTRQYEDVIERCERDRRA